MIWDLIEESAFDQHFSNPATTITSLLLDENIITQLKNQNPKLLEYLNSHKAQFMTELIDYTITLPKEEDGHDRCHKLPYISSELLAIDSELIYTEFFPEGQNELQNVYWQRLLAFLETPAAQNFILMGYFQKVILNLYAGNKMKTTVIVANRLTQFVGLLPDGSISDTIMRCLVLQNVPEGVVLTERKQIVARLVSALISGVEDVKAACADILGEVVTKFQSFSSGDQIVQELLSYPSLLSVYQIQASPAVNEFLIALLKKCQQRVINEHDQSVPILTLPEQHHQALSRYLVRQASNIRAVSKSTGFLINQSQQTVRKSNKNMYALLTLVGLALRQGSDLFVDLGLVSFLWNLVLLYPFNNILQGQVRDIFKAIRSQGSFKAKEAFMSCYQSGIISLVNHNVLLLRPFAYSIWIEARKQQPVTTDPSVLSDFQEIVITHFQPLLKYEPNHLHKSNLNPHKLIVDEEDKGVAAVSGGADWKQEKKQSMENAPEQQLAKQYMTTSNEPQIKTISTGNQTQKQIFKYEFIEIENKGNWLQINKEQDNMNFFENWQTQPVPNPQTTKENDAFGNFQSFF